MKIDAYAHCGISKYLRVEAVRQVMDTAQVDRAILVQHLGEFDNTYLETVVADDPARFLAVGLVDHRRDMWRDDLDRLAASGRFCGIRIPESALAENIAFCHGVLARSLVAMLDLPSGVKRAAALDRLAEMHPDGAIVISHLGYPTVSGERIVDGYELLYLAAVPSIAVLMSGQSMFCGYPYEALTGLRDEVIDAFGPSRVMWGSNFPERTDGDAYIRDLSLIRSLQSLSRPDAVGKVLGETAERVFFGQAHGGADA
jgi:L-fuconolactonase